MSAGSYRKINYSLRPAKAIERRMLCDVFQRLTPFGAVHTYRYIGFGSLYFADFSLFHRALGLTDMLSIEKDKDKQDSFEFNKPYNCIRMDYRMASEAIADLEWTDRMILWLDYDGKLDATVLADIGSVCAKAHPGTVFLVSVNVHPDREPDEPARTDYATHQGKPFRIADYRLDELQNRVGDALPAEIQGKHLSGDGLSEVSHRLMRNKVEEALVARNGILSASDRIAFNQLLFLRYTDGAKMLTYGGIFTAASDANRLGSCGFNELPFVSTGQQAYDIEVPCLTLKEMSYLNATLPLVASTAPPAENPAAEVTNEQVAPLLATNGTTTRIPGVPPGDIEKYAKVYRYFPAFAETVIY